MNANTQAQYLVQARQSGNASSIVSLVRRNPQLAAQISKLTTPTRAPQHDPAGQRSITTPVQGQLQQISAAISQKDSDAETLMQLFPELKLACEILVSSIISPNDMFTEELSYSIKDGLHSQPLQSALIPLVKAYLSDNYNVLQKLPIILRETLFGAGSYAVAVLPENSVDDLINGSAAISRESMSAIMNMDGVFKPIGYLGPSENAATSTKNNFGLEAFVSGERFARNNLTNSNVTFKSENGDFVVPGLYVTDNPNALKMPGIIERQVQEATITLRNKHLGLEKHLPRSDKINDRDLTALLYRNRGRSHTPVIKVKTNNELKRYAVGKPLILKLPSESVINCFPPGNPSKPIGHYVLLDTEGNPISRKTHSDHFDRMRTLNSSNGANANGDMTSFLLNKAATSMNGQCNSLTFNEAARVYAELVEADLLSRLRNGIYGSEVSISQNEEVYRLMLSRALSQQHTQVLFIPAEMMTYFAFEYNDDGSGKSLLEDARILGAMRGQFLFARVMGAIKNSIGRRKVNVEHDPDDPDPQSSTDMIMAEVLRASQHVSPASSINPTDILNQVQTMGIEFQFSGNPRMPSTKVDFTETNTTYPEPDAALDEDMRERMLNGVGVPAELVDSAAKPEFATTAISQHLLLAKRVRTLQEILVPLLTSHARQVLMADGEFIISLKTVIKENLDKITKAEKLSEEIQKLQQDEAVLIHMLAMEFLSNFEISLAKPDVKTLESQAEAIEVHEQMYDRVIKHFISDEALDASLIGEEAANRIRAMAGAAKAAFMRRWFSSNGIMPEVFELVNTDEEGRPAFDVRTDLVNHTEAIAKSMHVVIKKTTPVATALTEELNQTGAEPAGSGGLDTSSSTSDDSSSSEGGDGDLDGFDMSFPDSPA